MSRRHIQVEEELAHMAGNFIAREVPNPSVVGLVTITRAKLSEDYKNVTVFFSVLPQTLEQEALVFAKRVRSDFREYIKKNSKLHPIPTVDFEIDIGEKNRQRVDDLTRK
jgi:ribosome-binding factor A